MTSRGTRSGVQRGGEGCGRRRRRRRRRRIPARLTKGCRGTPRAGKPARGGRVNPGVRLAHPGPRLPSLGDAGSGGGAARVGIFFGCPGAEGGERARSLARSSAGRRGDRPRGPSARAPPPPPSPPSPLPLRGPRALLPVPAAVAAAPPLPGVAAAASADCMRRRRRRRRRRM
ncbi:hypothetical protein ACRRTK_000007 [Alexandromys fortis]